MAIWDKVKEGIDKAGKAAQDVFDEGKTRIDAYRAREQADKAAEALGYAAFRAWESQAELAPEAKDRLVSALRLRDEEARKLEKELADAKAGATPDTPSAAADTGPTASSSDAHPHAPNYPPPHTTQQGSDAPSTPPGPPPSL